MKLLVAPTVAVLAVSALAGCGGEAAIDADGDAAASSHVGAVR